jgi:transposase
LDLLARNTELEALVAAKDAEIAALTDKVAALTKTVERLLERLGQNSSNSNRPPSSDPPGPTPGGRGGGGGGSKRKRGGQPGHTGRRRELLPETEVDTFIHEFPHECENCWAPLPEVHDPKAKRYQFTELPPIKPHTTEIRRHGVACPKCRHRTLAALDPHKIPASPFGPRLMGLVCLLTGVYHLSRRSTMALLRDVLGIELSLGAISAIEARVSEAVVPAVDEAWKAAENAPVKHTDGTGWLQAGAPLSLWTIATAMVTVFKIVSTGSRDVLRPLYGKMLGILVSDRATALTFWAMERRQVCWAHLLRKFVAFSERDGPANEIGGTLLDYTVLMFDYWHDYKAGTLSRTRMRAWMAPVRQQIEALLEKAAAAGIERMSGSCADILEHRLALWTFLDEDDVEPTNNHAERELRAFVLWRKRSFGSQSVRGNLFAERVMTIAHTARKQSKNVLAFLTACCEAQRDGGACPSLLTPRSAT